MSLTRHQKEMMYRHSPLNVDTAKYVRACEQPRRLERIAVRLFLVFLVLMAALIVWHRTRPAEPRTAAWLMVSL
jgi:hypothetical protein